MDAMLLAAGYGSRLRPLTDRVPKPLVPVAGIPVLERIARRLIGVGVDRLIINTHHLGSQIREFVEARDGFGVDVQFSHEAGAPLETGGGLARAGTLIRRDAPFFLHNTDILSDLPLSEMYEVHAAASPLATLAVMQRETRRYLLFDEVGLFGRVDHGKDLRIQVREPVGKVDELAFAGVHVVSPVIFDELTESGAFSIFDPYLRLANSGLPVIPFRVDGYRWIDIGKPDQLARANRLLERSLP